MVWKIPDWWQITMLALAAFRVYRLIARDTLTEPIRDAFTYPDDATVDLGERPSEVKSQFPRPQMEEIGRSGIVVVGEDEQPKSWRVYLSTLVRCPWCAGFYVSAGWWLLWQTWPHWTMVAAAPWAISAIVALLAKNLDA